MTTDPVTITQALKPCPFCGSSATIEHGRNDIGDEGCSVECSNDRCFAFLTSYDFTDSQSAIAAWNTRTESSPLTAISERQEGVGEAMSHDQEIVFAQQEAHKAGYRAAMQTIHEAEPTDITRRLLSMKPLIPSIYGPLIDQTVAALTTPNLPRGQEGVGEADALVRAEKWLRACSDWLLTTDLDMGCPMDEDPLDIADDLAALSNLPRGASDEPQ